MRVLAVHQFIGLINDFLRETVPSSDIAIEGEISDYRVSQNKWVSFDLKDEEQECVLKCFSTIWQLRTPLEDGMRVRVMGYPKIYERYGMFKLNVQSAVPVGEGALAKAYALMKKKLQEEGLFDVDRKRSIPRFPKTIGLITSRDAAAFGDFTRILNRRWGGVDVLHTHVHVQGREAVSDILGAFNHFNSLAESERPDVLVLTRGGGGLEDLHAFNDESVARAVYASHIPVICAVGHERDESLCDFVADLRASTPSHAAELIVPDRDQVLGEIRAMQDRWEEQLRYQTSQYTFRLERFMGTISSVVRMHASRVNQLMESLVYRFNSLFDKTKERIDFALRLLSSIDPTKQLSRGYSIVRSGGVLVKDVKEISQKGKIQIQFGRGSADATVDQTNP